MDFRGKRFEYVEIAEGVEGNRNRFITLSEAEKITWKYGYKQQAWRSIYSYPIAEGGEYSYAGYYFESDVKDFELNRKIILFATEFLHVQLDIPYEAFKFRFTNKSLWVEIAPSAMGIKPSKNLNETFRAMTITLNSTLSKTFGISNPLDMNVYSPRQLVRLTGSYLPKSQRYVIDVNYWEVKNLSYNEILKLSYKKRKLTHFGNFEFSPTKEAFEFYRKHIRKEKIEKEEPLFKVITGERKCVTAIKNLGVDNGQRNNALFYTAIHLKNEGYSFDECFSELVALNKTFDQEKVDSVSKIMATARSVYKSGYKFSCSKMREFFPDHIRCERCIFEKEVSHDAFKVYKNQILYLLKGGYKKAAFKAVLKKAFGEKISKEESESLKKIPAGKGGYFLIPKSGFTHLIELGSEITLFFEMLKSSPNAKILNPKLETKHYAKSLKISLRSIQRYINLLEDKGFICDGKIEYGSKMTKQDMSVKNDVESSENVNEVIYLPSEIFLPALSLASGVG